MFYNSNACINTYTIYFDVKFELNKCILTTIFLYVEHNKKINKFATKFHICFVKHHFYTNLSPSQIWTRRV